MPNALTLLARGAPPARATADASRPGWGAREAAGTLEMLRARQKGMDPALSDLLDDPAVTDVLINGTHAWVDRGGGLVRVDAGIRDEADARHAAIRLASACGARLDDACTLSSHPSQDRGPSSPCASSAPVGWASQISRPAGHCPARWGCSCGRSLPRGRTSL